MLRKCVGITATDYLISPIETKASILNTLGALIMGQAVISILLQEAPYRNG
jgi:hypothetical protein